MALAISVATAAMHAVLFIVLALGLMPFDVNALQPIGSDRVALEPRFPAAANLAGNFSLSASIRANLALIPATISGRCGKFPA